MPDAPLDKRLHAHFTESARYWFMPGDAVPVFVVIASVCIIILTILAIVVSAALIRASMELVSLAKLIRREAEAFVAMRATISRRVAWSARWASLLVRKTFRRARSD